MVFNILSILMSKVLVVYQIIWPIHLTSHYYYYYYYYYYYLIKEEIKTMKAEVIYSNIHSFFLVAEPEIQ